jgi:hypothetical protein
VPLNCKAQGTSAQTTANHVEAQMLVEEVPATICSTEIPHP